MKIAYIGSCLSGSVVAALLEHDTRNKFTGGLNHMRLDCLHEHWVKNVAAFPDKQASKIILQDLEEKNELNKNPQRISSQTQETLNSFQKKLQMANCLIMDNNYDLSSQIWEVSSGGEAYRLANLQIKKRTAGYRKLGLLEILHLAKIYQELIDHIRSLNRDLKIIFLQYPTDGFARVDGVQRVERAIQAAKELENVSGIIHIPLINIDQGNLSEKGAHYFSGRVYDIYAKTITRLVAGETPPAWFRGGMTFAQLEKWIDPVGDIQPNGRSSPATTSVHGTNPYDGLHERQFWKPAVAERYPLGITGIYDKKFPILDSHRISTFGSCFAQHIGHRLKANGFNFLDMEPAPVGMPAGERTKHGYGIYSARYGNVYTSLQMLQLYQQAFGEVSFSESWERDGRHYDPLRPNIFPGGFASKEEMLQERSKHMSHVRSLFETSDVIVLTMGLTECWCNLETGAAYPTAPGVTVGQFDQAIHGFRNLSFTEIKQHLLDLLARLKQVNPGARLLLTISPVPLTGTYEDRHVLVSTMHSKSVLRAVAGEVAEQFEQVDYFPSYEIIMSPPFRSMFFKNNLRSIHDEGVDFVMSHFFMQHDISTVSEAEDEDAAGGDFCDEAFLELAKHAEN